MAEHRPSGSMCMCCERRGIGCDKHEFSTMRKMKEDKDGTIVVVCSSFTKEAKSDSMG